MDQDQNQDQNGFDPVVVEAIASRLKDRPGALMLILHEVQDRFGYVARESVPIIAHALNLSRAEVHGVVTFYHDFRHQPPGRDVIRLCRAESCQAMGAVALADHVRSRLGVGFGETTRDGAFTLEAVYCLGNCGCSPAMVLNDELHGRVSAARFDELLAERKERRR
ncbi:MAG TPA: formate dehydrogenase subunit gamma [Candidatus Binataceae bacterium]|jgi:formate dehydrogenase subunit gamma|nr:formate dehydrogenase subunit gamma [Candidatus Binataceae bacterium]